MGKDHSLYAKREICDCKKTNKWLWMWFDGVFCD